jgi:hypothetical protein
MTEQKANYSVRAILFTLCLATVIDVGVGWWLSEPGLGQNARIAIALLPVPANLVLIALIVRAIRRLDDFLRQVHLEAVAIAFLLTGLAVFVYGYLERAHAVRALNVAIVWLFMAIFYGIGYLIAVRHYR